MRSYSEYIQRARTFQKKALEEFSKSNGDETAIRQSAEKAWGAVVQATNALFVKYGMKPPKGTTRREKLLFELERKNQEFAKAEILDKFTRFLYSLHVLCFYEGDFSAELIERDIRRVEDFINLCSRL